MFSAHRPTVVNFRPSPSQFNPNLTTTWYGADIPVYVMGCTDQFQFCSPLNGRCSVPSGSYQLNRTITRTGFNAKQLDIVSGLSDLLPLQNMYSSVRGRDSSALRAQETLDGLEQGPLLDNQWHIEVDAWFPTNLAKMQAALVEYAMGPREILPGMSLRHVDTICDGTKVRIATGTVSFSVLGLALIIGLGGFVILLNLSIDLIAGWVGPRWFPAGEYRRLNWVLDDKLQLQRMAFEGLGWGHWRGRTDVVPVTDRGERVTAWETEGLTTERKGSLDPEYTQVDQAVEADVSSIERTPK
jgi:hypothetical protein